SSRIAVGAIAKGAGRRRRARRRPGPRKGRPRRLPRPRHPPRRSCRLPPARGQYGTPDPELPPLYLHHPSSLQHDTGSHPERADRVVAIERELSSREWLGYRREEAPAATRAMLEAVHPPDYVDAIARISEQGGGMLD